jgi:hypothetical protein
MVKQSLINSKFLAILNDEATLNDLSKRVIDVRGHYSQLEISKEFLLEFLKSHDIGSEDTATIKNDGSIHWRLGDLLEVRDKSQISLRRILSLVDKHKEIKQWMIFSDSSQLESQQGNSQIPKHLIWQPKLDAEKTILANLATPVFIGTNSKMSFWIAIMRCVVNVNGITYLPMESCRSFNFSSYVSIHFY